MARLFVGIGLPPAHQAVVAELVARLRPLAYGPATWTRPDNAHLTLKFLGETDAGRLPEITAALARVAFAPFPLVVAGGGFFPSPSRPRVVWAGLAEGAGPCRALAAGVDAALARIGFAAEARPFAAHLTLGRLRDASRGCEVRAALAVLGETVWPTATVEAFALYESTLGPQGPRYVPRARFAGQ